MIARTWRGETAARDADAYVAYLETTGLPGYRSTPGNRGAYLLRRPLGDRTEFLTALVLGRPGTSSAPSRATTSTSRSSIPRTTAS